MSLLKPPSRTLRQTMRAGVVAMGLSLVMSAPVVAPAYAQSRDAAQLAVQIQEMQEQIRNLTGQVEGLQFQLGQLQTLIERMTEDNEFRFQALEGGTPGKRPAATPTDGATPSDALPQDPAQQSNGAAALPDPQPLDLGAPAAGSDIAADPAIIAPDLPPGEQPLDDLGDSADPLVGAGDGGSVPTLGNLTVDEAPSLNGSTPLDLNSAAANKVSQGDANAQYAAGYDAITRGDYAFAEDQFRQFIDYYPDDPQAPDATNWLGEALMQRGAYDDAALVLAEGYQKYESSPRARDLMLKLGMALVGAGEQDAACRTFFTLTKRYTDLTPAFQQRLNDEKSKANCPV